jgi:uncharacterized membrane protein YeaQ/YmgE (transglycosylase-associated protein family)
MRRFLSRIVIHSRAIGPLRIDLRQRITSPGSWEEQHVFTLGDYYWDLGRLFGGQIVKGSGMGILIDLLVGVVGSIIGGWIFGLLGLASYGLIGQLVMATVGAIVLLLIVKAIKRA